MTASHYPAFNDSTQISVFDRPGSSEVARLKEETARSIEAIDSPAEMIAEVLSSQLDEYLGPIPQSRGALRQFVISQFKTAAGPTAVSAMLETYVEREETAHIANAIRRMLIVIRSQSRPALTCDAIAIVMGVHIGEGHSMEDIARAHKITKQALSKRAIRICTELGLPPSVLMRSLESRESYRLKQQSRHSAARQAGIGNGSIADLKAKLAAAREHVSGKKLRQLCA